jgi:uncharacterized membrane protein YbhN (UPF0104 family)
MGVVLSEPGGAPPGSAPRTILRRWGWRALRLVVAALVVAGVVLVVRSLDLAAVRQALVRARRVPVAAGAALVFVIVWWRALYWRLMLVRFPGLPTFRLFRYGIAGAAASMLAPARAGDVLRVWLLRRDHGVPVPVSAGVTLLEKMLDAFFLLLLVTPLVLLRSMLPGWLVRSLALVAVIVLVLVVVVLVLARGGRRLRAIARVLEDLDLLGRPLRLAAPAAALLAAWLTDVAMVQAALVAVGADGGWARPVLALVTINLAIAVPATPGHVGALELGAVAGLDLVGVPRATSVAFALIYHVMQMVPLLLAGLLNLRLVMVARRLPPEPPVP